MGTWGTAIFSDDLASDIREDYRDLIGDGYSSQAATDILLKEYADSLHDRDEEPVFWLALAATQWQCGRLEERVKEQALRIIEGRTDLQRWEENPKDMVKRQDVLEKLHNQLLSPQPPSKKISKRFRDTCDWEIGELIAYRLLSNRFIIFQVVEYHTDKGGTSPVVNILKWVGETIPIAKHLVRIEFWEDLSDRPKGLTPSSNASGIFSIFQRKSTDSKKKLSFLLGRLKENELPIDRIQRLSTKLPSTAKDTGDVFAILWRYLDRQLEELLGIK